MCADGASQQVKRLEKEQAACPPTPSRPSLTPFKTSIRITDQPDQETLAELRNQLTQRDQVIKVTQKTMLNRYNFHQAVEIRKMF